MKSLMRRTTRPGIVAPPRLLPIVCIALMLAITLGYTAVNAVVRPTMHADSGFGFLGWDARGSLPFNDALVPDSKDIAKDKIVFQTTWSPGQYVFPGLLEKAGLSLGVAMVIVTALFSAVGLVGWFGLYRAFGFPVRTCLIATTLVACSQHFAYSFGIYFGGEVEQFGVAPWFLLLIWKLREPRWWAIPLLFLGAAAMVFAKLAAILVAVAAIAAAALRSGGPWLGRQGIRRLLVAGVSICLVGLVFYDVWFSRGPTAVSSPSGIHWSQLTDYAALAVSSIWTASMSLGALMLFFFSSPAGPLVTSHFPVPYCFLPFAVGTFAFVWWRLRKTHLDYLRFVLVLGLIVTAALVWTWIRGSIVSEEERHLTIVSLALFIGIVQSFIEFPATFLRWSFATVMLILATYGIGSQVHHVAQNLNRPIGGRGFRHWIANRQVIDFIRTIDVAEPDRLSALIVTTSPDIALEVRHVRAMSNLADFETLSQLSADKFHGRTPRLYVIIQTKLIANGKADAILGTFVDYAKADWETIALGDFVCFFQRTSPL
jgi:hypothetical protein